MDKTWDILIKDFRALGGIADNVYQSSGKNGRGIFPRNQHKSAKIFIPSSLLVSPEDICLENNLIRIKSKSFYKYNTDFINFFEYYQDNFSWGNNGKETTESFELGLKQFSSELKKLIKKYLSIDIESRHYGDWSQIVFREFLNARLVKFQGKRVLAPLWELVNHDVNSFPFIEDRFGLATPNYLPSAKELTQSYNYRSSLMRAFSYGFFCNETIVFSLPFDLYMNEFDINIKCKGLEVRNDDLTILHSNSEIIIDGLPIVAVRKAILIKHYMHALIKKIGIKIDSKYFLDKIISFNYQRRKAILDQLKTIDNIAAATIRKAIAYELELISTM